MLLWWFLSLTSLVNAVSFWGKVIDKIVWFTVVLVVLLAVAKQLTPTLQGAGRQERDPDLYAA
jgi:hypothetical protein